ncbi:hypothetical protein HDE69_002577 [Pedobacter cryoconitis]|uniref:Uncharacterized protein n=1 Tax=Pedobacter cryoconitis TaxID=188932 RepID=A0A7W9DJS4_9SPHI|nr:hypothetical protein [Pedobacter cryoconitis]
MLFSFGPVSLAAERAEGQQKTETSEPFASWLDFEGLEACGGYFSGWCLFKASFRSSRLLV